MPSLSFGEPFMIPREILSEPEQKMFDEVKENNPEEHKQRYKWWSMYDIMKFYGSGLIPKVNAANFFPFKIDLTAPELLQNKYRDPDLVNGFEVAMSKLNELSSSIADYYNQAQAKWTKETAAVTLSAATSKGGKRNISKPKTKKKGKKGGNSPTFVVDVNKKINEVFSASVLKDQCTQALFGDVFHSRNRIFLVDNQLPTYTQPTYEQLRGNADKLKAEKITAAAQAQAQAQAAPAAAPAPAAPAPAPAPAPAGGGKRKQKQKQKQNRKTHKHNHQYKRKKKSKKMSLHCRSNY